MKYLYETAFCYDDVIRQKSSEEVLHHILSPLEGKLDIQIPEGGMGIHKCYSVFCYF